MSSMPLETVSAAARASAEGFAAGGVLAIVEPRHGGLVARRAIDLAWDATVPLTLLIRPRRHRLVLGGCAVSPELYATWTDCHERRFDHADPIVRRVPRELALRVVRCDHGLRRAVSDVLEAGPVSSAVVADPWTAWWLRRLGVEVIRP